MSHKVKVFFFRHGKTDWNAEGRIQGHLDVPLNDEGRAQARSLIAPLKKLRIEALLSSDLSRALETARIISETLNLPLSKDPGLREVFLGKVQGMTHEDISKNFGPDFASRLRGFPPTDDDVSFLGSESALEVVSRGTQAVFDFLEQNPNTHCLGVASHGGVIRRMIQHAQASANYPAPIPNSILYPFTFDLEAETFYLELVSPFSR